MIDLILPYLPFYLGVGFCLAVVFIFSLAPGRGDFGMAFFIPAIILGWLPLILIGAVIIIRDFFFDNLERLRVDDQDKGGDDQ